MLEQKRKKRKDRAEVIEEVMACSLVASYPVPYCTLASDAVLK